MVDDNNPKDKKDDCCSDGKCECCKDGEGNDKSKDDAKDLKIAELEGSWKRALADYKNLERRVNEEKDAVVKFANFILLERLIPVLDNLQTLSKHISDKGLEMITKDFENVLKDEGVEEVVAKGEQFDPTYMEATEAVEGEEGKVMEVVKAGFKIDERVLRPARVKVGKKG